MNCSGINFLSLQSEYIIEILSKNLIAILLFSSLSIGAFFALVFLTPVKKLLSSERNNPVAVIDTLKLEDGTWGYRFYGPRDFPDFHRRAKNPCMFNPLAKGKRPLDHFFAFLVDSADKAKGRIAHYGDSQIEGDRVTCSLREKMQTEFGGNGIGFVPFTAEGWNKNYSKYGGVNWARYTVFHKRYSTRKYGYGGTLFKYLRVVVDSLKNDTSIKIMTPEIMDSVRYYYFDRGSLNLKFRQKHDHEQVSLMYGKISDPFKLIGYDGNTGAELFEENLNVSAAFGIKKLKFPKGLSRIKLDFIANNSPVFYGLLFDGEKGVQVDNLPIRGHSGDGLMLIDSAFISKQINELNVKLIIFQYGMNTVPYYRSDSACKQLRNWYFDLFNKFKKSFPKISILVVGPGDMATHTSSGYVTYRYMPKINESIKSAALDANCAYWDVYSFMGGQNSVFDWHKKGLVVMNGHFKDKGQQYIGEQMFETLMIEYREYLHTRKSKLQRK